MYKKVKILSQSKRDILLYKGRIVEVYFEFGRPSNGISYWSGMCEITSMNKPDFDFVEIGNGRFWRNGADF